MPARPILRWPDPRLSRAAAPVAEITDEIRAVWEDMIDTMEAMPGWGLAAPQIGVGLRLAVVDASRERGKAVRMANPELISAEPGEVTEHEASPCLPGVSAPVARPVKIAVAYVDRYGMRVRDEFEGLWARSVLHQIDHLDGKLYIHRLSRVKREMLLKKARKHA